VPPQLAVVIPVHNEADNIGPLIAEIHAALADVTTFEVIAVDDGSDDETPRQLAALVGRYPRLRALRHRTNVGQSTAIVTAVRAATAGLVATLDGDGQNNPADIPELLKRWALEAGALGSNAAQPLLLTGWRTERRDTGLRRLSSRIANAVRGSLLGDRTPDTGCGLKLFQRSTFLAMPYFDHMHRFLPALVIRMGGRVVSVPVRHRPRIRGRSHYGVLNRLGVGLVDLAGVMWLRRRAKVTGVDPIEPILER
jgi:dolichol-phosphate mannosyltransferase